MTDQETRRAPMPPAPVIDCTGCGFSLGKDAIHFMPNGATVLCRRCWRKAGRPETRWLASRANAARLLGLWPPFPSQTAPSTTNGATT